MAEVLALREMVVVVEEEGMSPLTRVYRRRLDMPKVSAASIDSDRRGGEVRELGSVLCPCRYFK